MEIVKVKARGMGWLRDLPDFRDYTPEHKKIKPMLKSVEHGCIICTSLFAGFS